MAAVDAHPDETSTAAAAIAVRTPGNARHVMTGSRPSPGSQGSAARHGGTTGRVQGRRVGSQGRFVRLRMRIAECRAGASDGSGHTWMHGERARGSMPQARELLEAEVAATVRVDGVERHPCRHRTLSSVRQPHAEAMMVAATDRRGEGDRCHTRCSHRLTPASAVGDRRQCRHGMSQDLAARAAGVSRAVSERRCDTVCYVFSCRRRRWDKLSPTDGSPHDCVVDGYGEFRESLARRPRRHEARVSVAGRCAPTVRGPTTHIPTGVVRGNGPAWTSVRWRRPSRAWALALPRTRPHDACRCRPARGRVRRGRWPARRRTRRLRIDSTPSMPDGVRTRACPRHRRCGPAMLYAKSLIFTQSGLKNSS